MSTATIWLVRGILNWQDRLDTSLEWVGQQQIEPGTMRHGPWKSWVEFRKFEAFTLLLELLGNPVCSLQLAFFLRPLETKGMRKLNSSKWREVQRPRRSFVGTG